MERNRCKVLRGKVVSDKMDKTVVVEINTTKSHPLYGRQVKYTTRFKAHDENNDACRAAQFRSVRQIFIDSFSEFFVDH